MAQGPLREGAPSVLASTVYESFPRSIAHFPNRDLHGVARLATCYSRVARSRPGENEAGFAPHQLRDGAPCVPASVVLRDPSTANGHFPRGGFSKSARMVTPTPELPNLAPETSNTLNMEPGLPHVRSRREIVEAETCRAPSRSGCRANPASYSPVWASPGPDRAILRYKSPFWHHQEGPRLENAQFPPGKR